MKDEFKIDRLWSLMDVSASEDIVVWPGNPSLIVGSNCFSFARILLDGATRLSFVARN